MSFMDWGSVLLLIAVWVFFMYKMGLGKKGRFLSFYKTQAEQTDELKRQTALLERIAIALERGKPPV